MSENFYSEKEYRRAKRKVKAKKGFYWHLATYVIIIGFLFFINLLTDPYDQWFLYPMLSWGVAILFHYIGIFGIPGFNFNDKEWEKKQIEKELRKNASSSPSPTLPDEELELRDFKKLRDDWKDSDFV